MTDLQADIDRLGPWFHNLKLPDGRGGVAQTRPDHPFGDFPQFKFDEIQAALPSDLSGKRCLDIGTNSGFYAFELARRGGETLGIDLDDHYLKQARYAADRIETAGEVTFRQCQIYDLAADAELGVRFDVILFMGVFYHLRYPLLGLDVVSRLLADDGVMIFQTLQAPGDEPMPADERRELHFLNRERLAEPGFPRMAFFEHGFNGDKTNWWAADPAACEAMLRSSGLAIINRPGHEIYVCRPDPDADVGIPHLRDAEYRAALGGLKAPLATTAD